MSEPKRMTDAEIDAVDALLAGKLFSAASNAKVHRVLSQAKEANRLREVVSAYKERDAASEALRQEVDYDLEFDSTDRLEAANEKLKALLKEQP